MELTFCFLNRQELHATVIRETLVALLGAISSGRTYGSNTDRDPGKVGTAGQSRTPVGIGEVRPFLPHIIIAWRKPQTPRFG